MKKKSSKKVRTPALFSRSAEGPYLKYHCEDCERNTVASAEDKFCPFCCSELPTEGKPLKAEFIAFIEGQPARFKCSVCEIDLFTTMDKTDEEIINCFYCPACGSSEIDSYEEELDIEKKDPVRILFKKCLKCSYLVDWEYNINKCIDDVECPAQRIKLLRGRNPQDNLSQGDTIEIADLYLEKWLQDKMNDLDQPDKINEPIRKGKTMPETRKHDVSYSLPEIKLGNADIVFKIRKNGKLFGTLKISIGNMVWLPYNGKYERVITWDEFASYAKSKE
jgi:hypothetical protein